MTINIAATVTERLVASRRRRACSAGSSVTDATAPLDLPGSFIIGYRTLAPLPPGSDGRLDRWPHLNIPKKRSHRVANVFELALTRRPGVPSLAGRGTIRFPLFEPCIRVTRATHNTACHSRRFWSSHRD